MGIGQLLSQAWREYRANAVVSARIMALYYILPMIVAIGIILFVVFGTGLIPSFQEFGTSLTDLSNIDAPEGLADAERTAQAQAAAEKIVIRTIPAFMVGIVLVLAFFFISFFAYSALLGGAARSSTVDYSDAFKAGKEIYWSLMGYFALFMLIVLALEPIGILLIVGSLFLGGALGGTVGGILLFLPTLVIIALVFLAIIGRLVLAPYIIAREHASVIDSFRKSWALTRSRTWTMIGYIVFITFMSFCIMIILSLLTYPFSFSLGFDELVVGEQFTQEALLFEVSLQLILQIVFALFVTPFIVYFFKQVYSQWSTNGLLQKRKRHL